MVHPAFSLARLHYDRDAGIVTYDRRPSSRSIPSATAPEQFSPLDALIALTAFIPEKGQQVVRYCGYCSNRTRGQRRRQPQSAAGISSVAVSAPEPEPDDFRRHSKRAWARLIRKVWAADPLACPKCGGQVTHHQLHRRPGHHRKDPASPQALESTNTTAAAQGFRNPGNGCRFSCLGGCRRSGIQLRRENAMSVDRTPGADRRTSHSLAFFAAFFSFARQHVADRRDPPALRRPDDEEGAPHISARRAGRAGNFIPRVGDSYARGHDGRFPP